MTLMQKYVRMKQHATDGFCTCCTCGKTGDWRSFDGGHFISRQFNATCLLEENIHTQCKGCNRFMAGKFDDYTIFMINTYGVEFIEELNQLKHQGKKFTRGELMDIISDLKAKIKEISHE